jgi:hypothetical protein
LFVPFGILGVPALAVARSRSFPGIGQDSLQNVAATLRALGPPPEWAPTTWGLHVLLGDDRAIGSGVLLFGGALAVLMGALVTFERSFQPGWERVRFVEPRPQRRFLRALAPALAGPVLNMLHKDLRVLVRDPRWRTTLLVSLVALGVPLVVFSGAGDAGSRLSAEARFWIGLFPVPYLAYIAGSQHGAATLAYEGRNLALLRAAPVGLTRLLMAKLVGAMVLVVAITTLATLVLGLRYDAAPHDLVAAFAAAIWLALGGTLAGLAGAALTADFEGDNPQRRVGCFGALLTSGLGGLFFVTNTGLLVWMLMRALGGVPRPILGLAPVVDWIAPALALLGLAALVVAAQVGVRRLANWEAS